MALTNAERQRRYRERKRTEQRQDRPAVTEAVTPPVTGNAVTPDAHEVPDLGRRGQRLWSATTDDGGPDLNPRERVLLEEACRTADRLDVLDRILRGDEDSWMRLHSANEDGSIVKVVLNNALAEARQQQVALKALLAELRQSRTAGAGKAAPGRQPRPQTTGGEGVPAGITDLTARIARRSQPAG